MSQRLYVGNVPYEMTEDRLREVFGEFGQITRVDMPTNRDTGKPRGFAFVELETMAQAKDAIEHVSGRMVRGRPVRVAAADDKKPRPRHN